ncbi:MAG TPA: hypothetical protein VMV89_01335 [Candidatus Paceibacterota bacterium]|nr:hypothetical protein [Candidatus Paceibacterota bacterium]
MDAVDFILNLAGLLLWANWRSTLFDPVNQRTPATLIGALRRAAPTRFRHWHLLAAIGALLVLRALFYWQIGSETGWSGKLDFGFTVFSFPGNLSGPALSFFRMLVFSIFSFARLFGIIYLWLVLLSILDGPMPTHRLVKMQLGKIDGWPRWMKFSFPFAFVSLFWWLASWLLTWLQIIPKPFSAANRVEEALVIGLGSYLVWKFLIGALLVLHLLGSYIYFGKHPFWKYVDATAQTLLKPLGKIPLRAGKADFAPVVGIALVFSVAELAAHGLASLYALLSS